MPRDHLDAYVMQVFLDVGGVDMWLSSWWNEEIQWWVGWHSLKDFVDFHLTQEDDWFLIGYELWPYNRDGCLLEAYYADPNPSTTRKLQKTDDDGHYQRADLTPQGHYHLTYDRHGNRTCNTI